MAASNVSSSPRRGILDLPEDVQREICSHCSQCDLICLSLVCKSFHELAAAQLYRNFHIVFPDEDDPTFDSPIDGLAGGLDTFVTSEYDYAKHLRDLSLDTLSSGDKAETAYKPYLHTMSCGKFMNTLLLLTLRKSKALTTFRWNIRVELSRPVYKALHAITTLKILHLRMQAGPSLYETPPPLPYYVHPPITSTAGDFSTTWPDGLADPSLGTFIPPVPPMPSLFATQPMMTYAPMTYAPPPSTAPPLPVYKPSLKGKNSKKQRDAKEPPTISGFKDLETLCLLDIDNLDVISEIQACVRNSSSKLRKLKLSFSDRLANSARKPCVDVDPNESDDDDEFQVVPMNSNQDDGSGPAKAFRAQEERKSQEGVLGRIFDIEPFSIKKFSAPERGKKESSPEQPSGNRKEEFVGAIKAVSERLFAGINGNDMVDVTQTQQEMLDILVKAAKQYVEDVEKESTANASNSATVHGLAKSTNEWSIPEAGPSGESNETADKEPSSGSNAHDSVKFRQDDGTKPEDIDVAAPEEQLVVESQEEGNDTSPNDDASTTSISAPTPTATSTTGDSLSKGSSAAPSVAAQKDTKEMPTDDEETLNLLIEQTGEQLESLNLLVKDIKHELNVVTAEIEDAKGSSAMPAWDSKEELERQVSKYARDTRGIALHSLSIHLIPVKASVLGRAIDLRSLKRLTLLNVGNQAPLWTLMAKENAIERLPLCKIFTDHVSPAFLQLVSQLDKVEELFMLERNPKYKPESFAPKVKVPLEMIRRLALKKHLPTLKRLMIKNQADGSWDMDDKTIQLICKRGKVLEELAVIMGIRAVHAFLQYLSGLVRLRALHIISFRNDDTCLSVMRETRRFIVDTVSHYPELQLEWISMGDEDRAERIIRRTDMPKKLFKKDKGKGKDIIASPNPHSSLNDPFPILPVEGWDVDCSSDDDIEDDEGTRPFLRLDLIEGICFYDVWGVRIFKKEILAARL